MRPRIGLIAAVLATIGFFSIVDVFLARVEQRELEAEARHDADQGAQMLAAGRAAEAVDNLRKAHAIERDNSRYSLELAEALMASGKTSEAASILSDALEQSPNDGEANLIEARLMTQLGQLDQAQAYYHRAIYGFWPQDAQAQRIRVRLELAELLAAHKLNQALLAELIPLDADAQNDLAVQAQVAHLYLVAGAPERAVAAYRALIRDNPGDAQNYAGLGEAELALGNYRDAQAAFQNAIRHGADVRARLDLASRMAGLDPTPRSLSAAEKFARSGEILQLARDSLARCATTANAQKLIQNADEELSKKIRGPVTNEMAEDRLALAQTIWQTRQDACPGAPSDETLALIMTKLAE